MKKFEKRALARQKTNRQNRIIRRHRKNPSVCRFLALTNDYEVKKFRKILEKPTVKEWLKLGGSPEILAMFDELNAIKDNEIDAEMDTPECEFCGETDAEQCPHFGDTDE